MESSEHNEVSARRLLEAWLKGPKPKNPETRAATTLKCKEQQNVEDESYQVTYSSSFKA